MLILDRSVVMVGLGSLGHPLLVDGIHLRWQAKREIGFPWYGYYLLRRLHRPGRYLCLHSDLERLASAEAPRAPGPVLSLSRGRISSDAPLILADDFSAAGVPEVRLDSGTFLRVDCPETARKVRVVIGFRSRAEVRVTARAGQVTVGTVTLQGKAGERVEHEFEYDLITSVLMEAAPASLIDFCHVPVSQDASLGWEFISAVPYPLGLPVTHPNYPCTGSQPQDPVAAEATALSRIRYPLPAAADYGQIYNHLIDLVQGGPGGPAMGEISHTYTGIPDAGDPDPPPTMPALYPLDMVLLAALYPAIAQMVGLYWADRTADRNERYDYLIVAAVSQKRMTAESLKAVMESAAISLPGHICFNLGVEPAPDLQPAAWVDGYGLTGMTVKASDGTWVNAVNNAGLRWDCGLEPGAGMLRPDTAVLWWLHRAECGDGATPLSPAPADYDLVSKQPVIVSRNADVDTGAQWPPGWPAFPMHAVDRALAGGWYSYRVSGQDLFGRRGDLSPASQWKQADGATVIHPFAVRLTDDTPPPVPKGVEGSAVQPGDPLALKDALWTSWQGTLSAAEQASVIGLRVRWEWPAEYEEQAPDTKEFRIYYEPGLLGARPGRTTAVSNAGAASVVTTDISHSEAANAFYAITASTAASPLALTVNNLSGTAEDAVPGALAPCTVSIPPGHSLWKDFRLTAVWSDHYDGGLLPHFVVDREGEGARAGRAW